jgi:hypothetical protein
MTEKIIEISAIWAVICSLEKQSQSFVVLNTVWRNSPSYTKFPVGIPSHQKLPNAIKTPVIHLGIPRTASFAWIFMRTCARRNSLYNLTRTDSKVQSPNYKCRNTHSLLYPEHFEHSFSLPLVNLQSHTALRAHMHASNQFVQPRPDWQQSTKS